jgi:uncharacterized 2Fe-2S/4Fe-4S cluster protein (DUF4445 family)
MNLLRLAAAGTSGAAVAAQTAVEIGPTPFSPGFNVVAIINGKGLTGAPVIKIQSTDSEDADDVAAEWTDLMTTAGITTDQYAEEITLPAGARHVRTNVTTAGGAGTFDAYLLANN